MILKELAREVTVDFEGGKLENGQFHFKIVQGAKLVLH